MTTFQFWLFLGALIAPMTYQRTKFALHRKTFDTTRLRSHSGLQIHHGHWGFLFALIASYMFMFGEGNTIAFFLSGLGWGLMFDEIPPMLKMPSVGRDIELQVYAQTKKAAIILIASVAFISFLLFVLFGNH